MREVVGLSNTLDGVVDVADALAKLDVADLGGGREGEGAFGGCHGGESPEDLVPLTTASRQNLTSIDSNKERSSHSPAVEGSESFVLKYLKHSSIIRCIDDLS